MKPLTLFGFLVLFLISCAPVYVPNARNAPLFTKKGQVQGTAMAGLNGTDFQGAYSITDNIALAGNFAFSEYIDSLNGGSYLSNNFKYKYFEGAVGYFKSEGNAIYEVFAGYGMGDGLSFANNEHAPSRISDEITGKYRRLFIQPSIGFRKKDLQLIVTARLSFVDFYELKKFGNPEFINTRTTLFFEPAVTLKLNFIEDRLFIPIQAGVNMPANIYQTDYGYSFISTSVGLGFRFNTKKEKENSDE